MNIKPEDLIVDLSKLCYYDLRNPDGLVTYSDFIYDEEEMKQFGNHAQKDCSCDNCFYGRTKLTEQLLALVNFIKQNQK